MTDKDECALCKEKIHELFLGKIDGTHVKLTDKDKTKLIQVCSDCQKKLSQEKKDIKEEIKNL